MEEQRRCLACGEPLYGRADKKFCSDACRNSYHYEQNHNQSNVVRRVNAVLMRNYKILSTLNSKSKTFTTRKQLVEAGFDFRYFTNTYTTKTGSVYYIVYDQAYLKKDGSADDFLLVEFKDKNGL